ncbi:hypothetical protein CHGG_05525 [Chaetomium globosum CBS 148.51]|uniref:uncharacterized protein n=1 Tax=Chaetomium globosum (strain ATCC 6205 / CBS 148.51 / DSM 1962 / NBRC 6347 / NRRL 1970) TaxID=306901 RepID=UPI00006A95B1|nr:uncharacterized protein CHGG_05525 [Chaetomium globosum CBS 148.51]EAQ88906.1 hypothetical protein CHGG_05525 [Chaetomium globosum CBS 148.51]
MREFMHYVTNAFYGATELIDFPLPRGLRLTLSSLATPHFATSYQLGSVGIVDGSISYLHSSVPLTGIAARSDRIPLPALLRSYRRLHDLGSKDQQQYVGAEHAPTESTPPAVAKVDGSSLLYGRLYLPQSLLEGMVVRRFTPALQVQLSAVSERSLRNGGTLLGLVQYDKRKYGVEGLASTDGGLLGVRGLYNFGGDASSSAMNPPSGTSASETNGSGPSVEKERIYGRFSAGAELYYGTLNKSGGMSLGARFATLPAHRGTPLTATLTINPLMGNINATYAVLAREYSEPAPEPPRKSNERSFQAKMEWRLDDPEPEPQSPVAGEKSADDGPKEEYKGVLKARFDQNFRFGLLWEGRVKSLIFSLGTGRSD